MGLRSTQGSYVVLFWYVMVFGVRDYNYTKKELHRRVWVGLKVGQSGRRIGDKGQGFAPGFCADLSRLQAQGLVLPGPQQYVE